EPHRAFAFNAGTKGQSSWNVIRNKRKTLPNGPLPFLKVGHHGSTNATPWQQPDVTSQGEPLAILDAILPVASRAQANAAVSTFRGRDETIPRPDLLARIGRRGSNTRHYHAAFTQAAKQPSIVPKFAEFEKASFASRQPRRTDLESILGTDGFIDVEIPE